MKLKYLLISILAFHCTINLFAMHNSNIINQNEFKKRTLTQANLDGANNGQEPLVTMNNTQKLEHHIKNHQVTFPLTVIIEAHLASNDQEEQARELFDYLSNPTTYHTHNPTRHALAQKWIRNATSRIFPDDNHFLTEIIANACDACVSPANAIGKSCLGFFSVFNTLKWGVTIEIKTSYYDTNKQLQSYSMKFEKVEDKEINVTINYIHNGNVSSPGTTVFIHPHHGQSFSDTLLSRLMTSCCESLRFYTHLPIMLTLNNAYGKTKNYFLLNIALCNNSNLNPVELFLSPYIITVQDKGRGISLWTALQDLLIPSHSIKKPQNKQVEQAIQIPKVAQAFGKSSRFFITTRGKTIICKKLPTPLLNNHKEKLDLFIKLPDWISTTLAHNEIVISKNGNSDEEVFIKQMILTTIQKTISGTLEHEQILYALYQALDIWEKESSSTHIKGRFSKYLQDQLNQALVPGRILAAPLEFIPLYNKAFKQAGDGITVVPVHPDLVYNNYEPLEEHLMKLGRNRLATPSKNRIKYLKQKGAAGELIFGLYVFCVPGITQTSHLGLRSCIFVPDNIFSGINSEQELINKLLLSLPERRYQATTDIKSSHIQTLTAAQQQIYNSFCEQYSLLFKQFNLSPDALLHANQFAYSWTENVTNPLASLVPNRQIITTRLMQDSLSFNMLQLILEALNTSPEMQLQMKLLHGTYLGGYRNLFNFGPQSLPYTYGEGDSKISCTFNGLTTHHCGVIAPLICMFDKKEEKMHLHTIMQFQKKDFLEKISSSSRDHRLSKYQLHIPSALGGTPLFFLGALAARKQYNDQAQKLITAIISAVKNPEELAFITATLIGLPEDLFNHILTPAGLETLNTVIRYSIQEKIEPDVIKKFYEKLQLINYNKIQNMLSLIEQESACKSIERIFEKLAQGQSNILQSSSTLPPELVQQADHIPQTKSFLLSQLFKAHCQNNNFSEILDQQNLEMIIEQILHFPPNELKKIEQCIEAGSERNDIDATVIEALQNSIDASREVYKNLNIINPDQFSNLGTIDIVLERLQKNNSTNEAIKLTMHDHAGFPSLKTLLTNFILPDLSEKSVTNGSIGEMGNGSFKMYQNAQVVHVLTRTTKKPNLCYLLSIKPIRMQGYHVVKDLELTCTNVSQLIQPSFYGTSITIILPEESSTATEMTLSTTIDFLHNYIGGTTARLSESIPFKIMLHTNNEAIHLNKDDTYVLTDIFSDSNNIPMIRVFKRNQDHLSSIISTTGIPFCSFDTFVIEQNLLPENFMKKLEKGYIIDFMTGSYEPVQSRTKLQLKILNENLRRTFLDIFYRNGLEKALDEQALLQEGKHLPKESFLRNNFTHLFSRCSIFQLSPSKNDQNLFNQALDNFIQYGIWQSNILEKKFFDFYKSYRISSLSFSEYIQEIHDLLIKEDEKHFYNMQQDLYVEHQADINRLFSLPTVQEKLNGLHNLKIKYQESITRDFAILNQARTLSRNKILGKWEQEKTNQLIQNSPLNGAHRGLFKTIVMRWINNKMAPQNYFFEHEHLARVFIEDLTKKVIQGPIQDTQQDYPNIKTDSDEANQLIMLLNRVNALFCSEYLSILQLNNSIQPISCFFSNSLKQSILGSYNPKTNRITLNHEIIDFIDMIILLKKIINFNPEKNLITEIQNHCAFQAMYQPTLGKVPTLIHELEHARRYHIFAQDPGKGGCENHNDGDDVNGNRVNFNACAQSWMEYAFSLGLLPNWIAKVKEILKQNAILVSLINKVTQDLTNNQTNQIITALKNIKSAHLQASTKRPGVTLDPKIISNIIVEDPPTFRSVKGLKKFLAQGNDVNKQYPVTKLTMLHKAVTQESTQYIEALLEAKADPNLQDAHGDTPLHKLFKAKHRPSSKEIANLLIAHQANLEITNNDGDTPLHIAVTQISGLYTCLLEYLQNVNTRNSETGKTLLHVISALSSDKSDRVLDILLKKQADVTITDAQGNLPLHYATQNKDLNFIEKLLNANKDLTINAANNLGKTPLFFAIQLNDIDIVDFLIQQGADPKITDCQGNNILHHAFAYQYTITTAVIKHIVTKLNNDFVNMPNHNGELPLHLISCHIAESVFKLIVNKTKNINFQDKYGNTPLHTFLQKSVFTTAVDDKKYKNFSYLADQLNRKKLPLNVRNCLGLTPQHCALQNNYPEKYLNIFTSKNLLALPEEFRNTPLHWAAENGLSHYVRVHIQSGQQQVNSTSNGLSALHLAAYHGHLDTVKVLLDLNADIHLTDSWGQTALHWAALGNHHEIINYLLEKGANPNAQDHLRKTPHLGEKNLICTEKLPNFSLNLTI